jgi:16S rRNA processing protein RimM
MIPPLTPIGRIAGKHGFRGEMNLIFDDEQYRKIIKKGNFLFVEFDKKGVPFLIESVLSAGQVVKLSHIDNEEQVSELTGKTILAEAKSVKPKKTGPFEGLMNFTIVNDETEVGRIIAAEEFPQGLMLTVLQGHREILIPAVEEWITGIDEKKQVIYMTLPEGLTEI